MAGKSKQADKWQEYPEKPVNDGNTRNHSEKSRNDREIWLMPFARPGLSKRTTSEGLREAFAKFGQVVQARVVTDRGSGYSKGFGFVRYGTLEEAESGIKGMDGKFMDEEEGTRTTTGLAGTACSFDFGLGGGSAIYMERERGHTCMAGTSHANHFILLTLRYVGSATYTHKRAKRVEGQEEGKKIPELHHLILLEVLLKGQSPSPS
ncbi:hypothetical protein Taro_009554 [Colocasia esculenta]|uniref:RRM domain-containing protein n=1 Tax=Colocasia esculenta TaxID=4460 RepID=A0A843U6U8_COLES|nr:hypothetical protein [Colocasia esculenta]